MRDPTGHGDAKRGASAAEHGDAAIHTERIQGAHGDTTHTHTQRTHSTHTKHTQNTAHSTHTQHTAHTTHAHTTHTHTENYN